MAMHCQRLVLLAFLLTSALIFFSSVARTSRKHSTREGSRLQDKIAGVADGVAKSQSVGPQQDPEKLRADKYMLYEPCYGRYANQLISFEFALWLAKRYFFSWHSPQ